MMQLYFSARPHNSGERRDVAVHGEHAVGDQQFVAGPVFGFLAEALAIGDVLVLEHFDRRARKAAAIDDGGVIQLVGKNQIVFAQELPRRFPRSP